MVHAAATRSTCSTTIQGNSRSTASINRSDTLPELVTITKTR
nr:hypothetical protein [Rhizobium setariae]